MGCMCSKRKREKLQKDVKDKMKEMEHLKLAKNIKDQTPSLLNEKQLIDSYDKIVKLYSENITRKKLNKKLINFIVDLHNEFTKEMLNRGIPTIKPLNKI
jgi:anaerobic ribonucleoside-triphosphate reductase